MISEETNFSRNIVHLQPEKNIMNQRAIPTPAFIKIAAFLSTNNVKLLELLSLLSNIFGSAHSYIVLMTSDMRCKALCAAPRNIYRSF